jgi:carboxypeptidase Taq
VTDARFEELEQRLGEIWDLVKVGGLAGWDQQTMMPPGGAAVRPHHMATISKAIHERLTAPRLGELLDDLRDVEEAHDYDSREASLIRVTRRDREKEVRVPAELREEMTRCSAAAYPVWVEARRTSDFSLFLPHLRQNVELRRRYAACFDVDEPYDALLDDFEPGMKTQEVRDVFEQLKEGLVPLIAEAAARDVDDSLAHDHFAVEKQQELERIVLERFGFREGEWRLDTTTHPFASSLATSDIRLTTRYPKGELSLFASMHEGGHGLYEHNIDPALERTPLCRGSSLAFHESQSRMFENLVGRSLPFWRWCFPHAQRLFPEKLGRADAEAFYRAVNRVRPSLIRVDADEATYGLHIILRFELEQELLADTMELEELPVIWNARMREYLGVEVPDDALGVLQDVHWARGNLGYFPTYALGNVIGAQLWERIRDDVPDLDEQLERGELAPLTRWLRERLWQHGRKFMPRELLERIVGGGLDAAPLLRYLHEKLGTPEPAGATS